LLITAWARSSERVDRSEVLWCLAWLAFGLLAYRNAIVALLLIAPVVADRLAATYPDPVRERSSRERRGLAIAATVILLATVVLPIIRVAVTPTIPSNVPSRLLATLRTLDPPPRVLNDYNVAGPILAFGGRSQVAIDGRADLSSPLLPKYLELIGAQGDFDPLLDKLRPTAALVARKSGIVRVLRERGWTEADRQQGYVLLLAP